MRIPPTAALAAFLALLAGAQLTALRDVWTLDPDAAAYLSLGRNLASGAGYVLEADPGPDAVPHAKYPPGWPVVVAALAAWVGPEAYRVLHAALVVALLAAAGLAYLLCRRLGYEPVVALAVAAATGLSQTFLELSVRYLRSEVLFSALLLAALWALLAAGAPGARWGRVVLASLLVAAATATRLAGIALLAVPAWQLVRPADGSAGRLRAAVPVVVGALVLGAWMGRGAVIAAEHPGAPDYGSELLAAEPRDLTKTIRLDMPTLDGPGLLRRVAGNLDVLARATAVLLSNVDKAAARRPVGMATLLVVALGLGALLAGRARATGKVADVGRCTEERRAAALFLAATLLLYLVWPFDQQERFYAPVLPLLLLAAGEGLIVGRALLAWSAERRPLRAGALLVGIALLVVLATQRSDDPTVLGRWSRAYAAMLVAVAGALALAGWWLARGRVPRLAAPAALLVPLVFVVPWAGHRFGDWPAHVEAFRARRADQPREGALAKIDVHPLLEQVAVHLASATPPGSVVMTDVPKMMTILSGRPCVPFRYRLDPPEIVVGEADYVFYTGELADVSRLVETAAGDWPAELRLEPIDLGGGQTLQPTVYRVP